jgi:hypothetical protein
MIMIKNKSLPILIVILILILFHRLPIGVPPPMHAM